MGARCRSNHADLLAKMPFDLANLLSVLTNPLFVLHCLPGKFAGLKFP